MQNKKWKKLLVVLLLLIIAGCGSYLFRYYMDTHKSEEVLKKAQTAKQDAKEEKGQDPLEIPIDFSKLQSENENVYAWIQIPGTSIDYPIVQHPTEELYYLDHNWEGESSAGGAIFTQAYNRKDFTDYNTVIYGHEMGNGTMFNDLHQYMDESYWTDHNTVVIYTPQKKLTYQIFAAVVYDDRHLMKSFQFLVPEDRQAFLDSLDDIRDLRSHIDDSVVVTTDDRIVTLSTCLGNESHHRYLVEAVLRNEEE